MSGDNLDTEKLLGGGMTFIDDSGVRHKLKVDPTTRALVIIPYEHWETHGERSYFVTASTLKDTAGELVMMVRTPNTARRAHFEITAESALAATFKAWRAPTGRDFNSATPWAIVNRDHESLNTSGLSICNSPATNGATESAANITEFIGSSSTSGKTEKGGGTGTRHEVKLARNTLYMFSLVSRADDNALTFHFDWYEHTDKD